MDLKGKRLCITGIGGFIGGRVAELAREHGMDVCGLELDPLRAEEFRQRGFPTQTGSVLDPGVVADAVAGAHAVLHTVAIVRESGRLSEFRRVNVEGAARVCEAARQAGVQAFVHLSSVMVYGFDFPRGITEEGPFRGEGNPYCQTKLESEAAVLQYNAPPDFRVSIVRPGDVYGPGSDPWIVRPLQMMRRGLFALPNGGRGCINHVYVDNLADAIFLLLESNAAGVAFNITDGAETAWRDFYNRLADLAGVPRPRSVPAWLLKAGIGILGFAERLLGRSPTASPAGVNFLLRPHPYSIERARSQLGYAPRVSLDEGLRRSIEGLV